LVDRVLRSKRQARKKASAFPTPPGPPLTPCAGIPFLHTCLSVVRFHRCRACARASRRGCCCIAYVGVTAQTSSTGIAVGELECRWTVHWASCRGSVRWRAFHYGFCCVRISIVGLRLLYGARFQTEMLHSRSAIEYQTFAPLEAVSCV
jgi:hypothetical protein